MSVVGTVSQVLIKSRPNFIDEVLQREMEHGCEPVLGAYERIKSDIIEAFDRNVTCKAPTP